LLYGGIELQAAPVPDDASPDVAPDDR